MNREAYGSLFALFGGANVLFAISMWVITQGGLADLSLPGLDPHAKIASSYFSIVLIGFLLFLTGLVGTGHVLETRKLNRAAINAARGATPPVILTASDLSTLIPAVGLGTDGKYIAGTIQGGIYATVIVLLFLIVPAASLIHLNKEVAGEGTVWNEELPAGAHLTAGCLLPWLWPFGSCDETKDPTGAAVLAAVMNLKDVKDSDDPPKFEKGNNLSRLWLTNHWCDVYWSREMSAKQVNERKNCTDPNNPMDGLSQSEARAFATLPLLGKDEADKVLQFVKARRSLQPVCSPKYATTCMGISDRSQACSDSGAGCRGVEWLRFWSPTLIVGSTLLGWLSTAFFLFSLRPRKP